MALDKLLVLFKRLTTASSSGKINWQRGSESSVFVSSFPNYSVSIEEEQYFDEEIGEPSVTYKLSILDQLGDIVEVVHPGTLVSLGERDAYQQLQTLHESARRKAMGVDKAIDEIISILELVDDEPPF